MEVQCFWICQPVLAWYFEGGALIIVTIIFLVIFSKEKQPKNLNLYVTSCKLAKLLVDVQLLSDVNLCIQDDRPGEPSGLRVRIQLRTRKGVPRMFIAYYEQPSDELPVRSWTGSVDGFRDWFKQNWFGGHDVRAHTAIKRMLGFP